MDWKRNGEPVNMDNQTNRYDNGGGYPDGNGAGSNRNNNGNGDNNGNSQAPKGNWMIYLMAALAVMIIALLFSNLMLGGSNAQTVKFSEFLESLNAGEIDNVEIKSDGYLYYTKKTVKSGNAGQSGNADLNSNTTQDGTTSGSSSENKTDQEIFDTGRLPLMGITSSAREYRTYFALSADANALREMLEEKGVPFTGVPANNSGAVLELVLYIVLPVLLTFGMIMLLMRKVGGGSGGPFSVGKNNAKVYVQRETGVTFKDVAGEDEAKESLVEVVDFLHNPGRYSKIGARLPKGALLVGPPGTGKTLLAKAVAGEAHVPFYSLTGSDFIELYVGVGASRVRDLFREATKNAPCIIFIDEIDAIGRSRDSKYGGGNEEREQTLNQLLSEMDGFDSSKGILILGATNRPEILDKALLRPGRFDRRIIVDKPDLKGRVEILKVHAKDVKMDETVDLDAIALATSGAVGSDLANMINEAAINAVKEGRQLVSQKDLFAAVEQVLVGKEKKDRIMSKEERRIVSYHEVGHALVSALQKNSEPVQKITIVPRTMGALGYVMHVPEEEKYLNTEAELRDMLVGLVAGRAAEEIVFDTVTTGASNDIERATNIARAMVTQYGMSKKFGLIGLATIESQYLDNRASLNCSDKTAAEIDQEVIAILKESYDKALELLRANRTLMDKLAEFLIEKETITGKEFMEIYRREKGIPEPEEKKEETAKTQEPVNAQAGNTQNADVEESIGTETGNTADTETEIKSESIDTENGGSEIQEPDEASTAAEPVEKPAEDPNAKEQEHKTVGRFSNRSLE